MITDKEIIEAIRKDTFNFITNRLIDRYIQEDRDKNIYDLSNNRMYLHKEKAKLEFRKLDKSQKSDILNLIYKEIIEHRKQTMR